MPAPLRLSRPAAFAAQPRFTRVAVNHVAQSLMLLERKRIDRPIEGDRKEFVDLIEAPL